MATDVLAGLTFGNTGPVQEQTGARAVRQAEMISTSTLAMIQQMVNSRNQIFNAFWNTSGVHPRVIVAALVQKGVSVASLFQHDAELCAFIAARALAAGVTIPASALPQPPSQYTWSIDPNTGAVTISDAPVVLPN